MARRSSQWAPASPAAGGDGARPGPSGTPMVAGGDDRRGATIGPGQATEQAGPSSARPIGRAAANRPRGRDRPRPLAQTAAGRSGFTSGGATQGPPAPAARSAKVERERISMVASRTSYHTPRSEQPTVMSQGSGWRRVAQEIGASWPSNRRTTRSSVISLAGRFSR
jgi:hypothetical protein